MILKQYEQIEVDRQPIMQPHSLPCRLPASIDDVVKAFISPSAHGARYSFYYNRKEK